MKKLKAVKEVKVERPPRATVSEKEAVKRLKEFSPARPLLKIITLYEPDANLWVDFKLRK